MRPFWKWFGFGAVAVLGVAVLAGMACRLAPGRGEVRVFAMRSDFAGDPRGRLDAVQVAGSGAAATVGCAGATAETGVIKPAGDADRPFPPVSAMAIVEDGTGQVTRAMAAAPCDPAQMKAAARVQAEQVQRQAMLLGAQAKRQAAQQAEQAKRADILAARARPAQMPPSFQTTAPRQPVHALEQLLAAAALGILLVGGVLLARGVAGGPAPGLPPFGFRPRGRGGRPAPAETGIHCPSCNQEVSRDWATCPHCGYRKYLAPDLIERRCPTCGTGVKKEWKACPYCSTRLEPPVEAPAPGDLTS